MAVEPRVAEYAELLVGRCLDVQPGWQVLIRSQPAARPVLEEMMRLIARTGRLPAPAVELLALADGRALG